MSKLIDMQGQVFNQLTVICRAEEKRKKTYWVCKCACGNTATVEAEKLRSKHTQSCGCLQKIRASEASTTHGQSTYPNGGRATKEYNTWALMRRRCEKQSSLDYPRYGGRGIYVCERWKTFTNFFDDMGRAPSKKHSIDRIDGDGPYSPDNCRWADAKTQRHNQKDYKLLECRGQSLAPIDWAALVGISHKRIHARLQRGWSVEAAIFTPVKKSLSPLTGV